MELIRVLLELLAALWVVAALVAVAAVAASISNGAKTATVADPELNLPNKICQAGNNWHERCVMGTAAEQVS